MPHRPEFILASTSPYRQALLARLGIPFDQVDPGVDESDIPGESPQDRATRLATAKATAVAGSGHSIIIASDQVAHMGSHTLPKPGDFEHAFAQLRSASGQRVIFTTAICLLHGRNPPVTRYEDFSVQFRQLGDEEISHYLEKDQPWNCAGSIKAESLGVALLDDTRGRDINTLYGLPLMLLNDMLLAMGINLINLRK